MSSEGNILGINVSMSDMLSNPVDRAAEGNPFASLAELGRIGQTEDRGRADRASENSASENNLEDNLQEEPERDRVELSEEEQREIQKLKNADRAARAHEQAHKAVGGELIIGGPYYDYARGPDNRLYAVAGEVTIDTSEIRDDPEANAEKMQHVRRTALAPRDPSPQDRHVASQAAAKETQSRAEAVRQQAEERDREYEEESPSGISAYLSTENDLEAASGNLLDSLV